MNVENNILQGVTLLAFWIPIGLMTYFCYFLVRRNIRKLDESQLSSSEKSITKFRVMIMTLPLLAFSCGFLFFTIKIALLILGL